MVQPAEGTEGMVGTAGETGVKGADGEEGVRGRDGTPGLQGATGEPGDKVRDSRGSWKWGKDWEGRNIVWQVGRKGLDGDGFVSASMHT